MIRISLLQGDCVTRMDEMPPESIDAIVCDPPYGLEFMGKAWDRLDTAKHANKGQGMGEFHRLWLTSAYRVLTPGGVVKAFSGSRTHHRLTEAMTQCGFEGIHIQGWIYSSGFPKSLNISKAIDTVKGCVREPKRIAFGTTEALLRHGGDNTRPWIEKALEQGYHELPGDIPVSPEAQLWDGWGTALKPAFEPVIIGYKPCV